MSYPALNTATSVEACPTAKIRSPHARVSVDCEERTPESGGTANVDPRKECNQDDLDSHTPIVATNLNALELHKRDFEAPNTPPVELSNPAKPGVKGIGELSRTEHSHVKGGKPTGKGTKFAPRHVQLRF